MGEKEVFRQLKRKGLFLLTFLNSLLIDNNLEEGLEFYASRTTSLSFRHDAATP